MLFKWIFEAALGSLSKIVGPLFNWLNARVDAKVRVHLSDNETLAKVGSTVIEGMSKADELNAGIRSKEGPWSPWVVVTIFGFMLPFSYHTWQVVLDSSAWHIVIGEWFLPTFQRHAVGSWRVAALPGLFETTEHAVIQSLFIGAGVAVGGIALIKSLRGRG